MKEHNFLLSIIVPTRNRTYYAFETAKQVLSIRDEKIQLVIQDNSDSNDLFKMLNVFNGDKRLKYNYTSNQVSFVENFNLAVKISEGEFICAIGDDDGVNSKIMEIVEWAKINSFTSVQYKLKATYVWPNSGIYKNKRKIDNGNMIIGKVSGNFFYSDTELELKKLFLNGCHNYLKLNLIKLYHGIVKRDCMEEVKNIFGSYFKGLSPDIFSVVALSMVSKKNIFIDYPFTISGICGTSGSADSATGRHTGRWEDAPHFKGQHNYKWNELVPKIYSVETIWADSALAALDGFTNKFKFNVTPLIAYCLINHPEFSKPLKKHYFDSSPKTWYQKLISYFILKYHIIKGPFFDFVIRVFNKIFRKKSDFLKLSNIENIRKAESYLSKYLGDKIDIILSSLKK